MPTATSRDSQRGLVYAAEDAWAARLDAARRGAPMAQIAGSNVVLPAERRFGTLAGAQNYAARVVALPSIVAAVGVLPPPVLRMRRGGRAAHWEPPGTIAVHVPPHGEPWGLRETTLLHEVAHHVGELGGLCSGHRAPFPAVLLLVVGAVLGPEAAFALSVSYQRGGVAVGAL
ncbi:MAG TPA: TIGR04338 family metallohydrolase [Mycobacteriales bacterium]|nr:TIGR04338 family metallohydrolase [Mycobacteriales bacterium]